MIQMCKHATSAIRVHRRTISLINLFDTEVDLEGNEENFFMIYCVDSDHEEYQIIDKDTYARTYEQMPDAVMYMNVNTID